MSREWEGARLKQRETVEAECMGATGRGKRRNVAAIY